MTSLATAQQPITIRAGTVIDGKGGVQRNAVITIETSGHHVAFSLNGRHTRVGSYPVGIEPRRFQALARRNVRSPLVKNLVTSLGGRTLIIGVDRLDYSKGLVQRLEAFEIFLARNPDWRGNVTYLQITPKNRSEIPEFFGESPYARRDRSGAADEHGLETRREDQSVGELQQRGTKTSDLLPALVL